MRPIGFSTGALKKGDFRAGMAMIRPLSASGETPIELSALRESELQPLVNAICSAPDSYAFDYASVHAPSGFGPEREAAVVAELAKVARLKMSIVLHPDVIVNLGAWRPLGKSLCIENMDKRKPTGRTVSELAKLFEALPEAAFCFDIGHARQNDPTMGVASDLLRHFGNRLRQVHMSDVNSSSRHERLNGSAISAFQKVARLIPPYVPIILESPVLGADMDEEVRRARLALPISGANLVGRMPDTSLHRPPYVAVI